MDELLTLLQTNARTSVEDLARELGTTPADVAERILVKGAQIYVEGRLQSRSWEDKEGNKRHVTEVVADNLLLLSKRQQEESRSNPLMDILTPETEPLGDLPF